MSATQSPSRLRLRTIVRLRWLAVFGQLFSILFVYFVLKFELPLTVCLTIVGFSAALNVVLRFQYPSSTHRLRNHYAFAVLSYDIIQLAALLYLTGGLQNPFIFLMAVPVTISASTQSLNNTLALGAIAVVSTVILAFSGYPLPWGAEGPLELPDLYKVGLWVSVVCGIVFSSFYSWRIANETRQMSDALTATEMVLAREQRLTALDGLAAAAAHELGTPLGTITVVAKELQREFPEGSPHYEDVKLIKSQADRCKEILQTLTHNGGEEDEMFANLPVSHLIEEVVEIHRVFEKSVKVSANPSTNADKASREEPVLARNPGIIYGLGNIVENAVDFAQSEVIIIAQWNEEYITIKIYDDGEGIPTHVLDRMGEPFVTTRPHKLRAGEQISYREGLGLGYFIAKTLLERSGAKILLSNRKAPYTGAKVEVTWRRSEIDMEWNKRS
ncbi:MAG: ActS/PrrB/RegB family redox-sensitive histidine kinase [Methyloligellaceae bacterium]